MQHGRAMWQAAVVQSSCVVELFDTSCIGWCRAEVAASEKERDSQAAALAACRERLQQLAAGQPEVQAALDHWEHLKQAASRLREASCQLSCFTASDISVTVSTLAIAGLLERRQRRPMPSIRLRQSTLPGSCGGCRHPPYPACQKTVRMTILPPN